MYFCLCYLQVERMMTSKLSMLKEKEVLSDYFPEIVNGITDISSLLPYFVKERIITRHDLEMINAITTTRDQVIKFLNYISGPLDGRNIRPFQSMLRIMEERGNASTRDLAKEIKSKLINKL